MSLLKFQIDALSVVVGIIMGHSIMDTHASRIDLGYLVNDFCRSCRDEEERETITQLLGTCSALCQRRIKYVGTYYLDDLEVL